jgi:hypothetical protein
MTAQNSKRWLLRRCASIIAIGASVLATGATPASAADIPYYDPGVSSPATLNTFAAECGIVLFDQTGFQGKKICAPAVAGFSDGWFPLEFAASYLGGDMNWTRKISSIQVRPGLTVEMSDGYSRRTFRADTPDLGDFNDRATGVRVYREGFVSHNVAAGRSVTTNNAASCTSSQGPQKAVDNSVASIYTNKWCATALIAPLDPGRYPLTLRIDLGQERLITGAVVHHAGDGPLTAPLGINLLRTQREPDYYNTYRFTIKTSRWANGPWDTWSFQNTYFADVTNHDLRDPESGGYGPARYVLLEVTAPTYFPPFVARIQEFEVLGF